MMKLSNIASAAALVAAALAPGLAQADAVAQSILNINGFVATLSNPAALLPGVTVLQNANTSADFNGVGGSNNVGATAVDIPRTTSVYGPNSANYLPGGAFPGTTIGVGAVNGNFAGSSASITGSVLAGGAAATLDSTVSITPSGDGSADSNLNLTSGFTFDLASSSTVNFAFNAEAFLRAYLSAAPGTLGPLSTSNASYNWDLKITKSGVGGNQVLWSPNGDTTTGLSGTVGGVENLDPFTLNDATGAIFEEDNFVGPQTGAFSMTTGLLTSGRYTLTITHKSVADATVQVIPEPEMLSLIGIALFGAAFASRRRLMK